MGMQRGLAWWMAALLAVLSCRSLPLPGKPDLQVAQGTQHFQAAEQLIAQQKYAEAVPHSDEAARLFKEAQGENGVSYAMALVQRASIHAGMNQYDRALPLLQRALAIREKALGPNDVQVGISHQALGMWHEQQGDRGQAALHYQRALLIFAAQKPQAPQMTEQLGAQIVVVAGVLDEHQRAAEALALREAGVKLLEPTGGLPLAIMLTHLGQHHQRYGEAARGEPFFRRALEVAEKVAPDSVDVGNLLNNLAENLREQGRVKEAFPVYARALGIYRARGHVDTPELATLHGNLGLAYQAAGRLDLAEPELRRALQIREGQPEDLALSYPLNNLGELMRRKGRLDEAEGYVRRALHLRQKLLGRNHHLVGTTLMNLALIMDDRRDDVAADALYREAEQVYLHTVGTEHPLWANLLHNYGQFMMRRGNVKHAVDLFASEAQVEVKLLGPDHVRLAATHDQLGRLFDLAGDVKEAEAHFQRAYELRLAAWGADNVETALSQLNLAEMARRRGDLASAQMLATDARAGLRKQLADGHPHVSAATSSLASLAYVQGRHDEADRLFKDVLRAREEMLGPAHPLVADVLENLASVDIRRSRIDDAVAHLGRALGIREQQLANVVQLGSEGEKLMEAEVIQESAFLPLSLHLDSAPDNPRAAELAWLAVLRFKGRVADTMAEHLAALKRTGTDENHALLRRIGELRTSLARQLLEVSRDSPAEELARFNQETAELVEAERTLSRNSPRFAAATAPIDVAGVQRLIPRDAVLVEVTRYHPRTGVIKNGYEQWGEAHYAACVVTGKTLRWVKLGPVAELDRAAETLIAKLARPDAKDYPEAAAHLADRVWRPIRSLVPADARSVLISAVGALNLVPWGTLPDDGKMLLERYTVVSLDSARDLVRMNVPRPRGTGTVVVANPAFGARSANAATGTRGLRGVVFDPLPGTEEEGQAVASLWADARVLGGADAQEARVKALRAPAILHVATHGFALDNPLAPTRGTRGLRLRTSPPAGQVGSRLEQSFYALAFSGLALANANAPAAGGDDGRLTALEVAAMDLWGTQLVVLSACSTLGRTELGTDGVFGLRRGLVLAGAQTQVVSLWDVDDDATRALMTGYYQELRRGQGRAAALRHVQLKMKRDPKTAHPYYWAAFTVSGDWRPLEK